MTKTISSTGTSAASHRLSLMGVIVTLGIVFGDIGTSPLYVMKAIVRAGGIVDADYITGAVSAIIWTLTLQTTVKYVLIALRADNKGEGGILALYALVRRYGRKWLYLAAILGAGTLVADGVITPSITVLSAVEGLRFYQPDTPVIAISLCIITVLFFIQQFGTDAIGRLFGPLMLVWFVMMGIFGAMHIADWLPILRAFNPMFAVRLLTESPQWFFILGAVFLCTTGAEALYSDLGHCGAANIRVSWALVKAALILNYLGQGAWIIANKEALHAWTNPFFAIMPRGFLMFGIVMATIAAIIASQALISGCFTIFSEAMNLNFFPRLKIKYPTEVKGQLYIPFINAALFLMCVLVTVFFQSSEHMEAAYGLAITITMLMTTLLLTAFLSHSARGRLLVVPFAAFYFAIETIFLVANMAKFMHGGWVTLLLAGIISTVMYVWYNGERIRQTQVERRDVTDYFDIISDIKEDTTIEKSATNVVYLSKLGGEKDIEQRVLYSIVNKHPVRADHYILLHIDYQDEPSTLEYDFFTLIPGTLYRINLYLGFRVQPMVNHYFRQVIEDQVAAGAFSLRNSHPSLARHKVPANFIFIIINRVFSIMNFPTLKSRMIMSAYLEVARIKLSIAKALGLNTSNVVIENVPLVVRPRNVGRIRPHAAGEEQAHGA